MNFGGYNDNLASATVRNNFCMPSSPTKNIMAATWGKSVFVIEFLLFGACQLLNLSDEGDSSWVD